MVLNPRSIRRRSLIFALPIAMILSTAVWACPNCKDSTPDTGSTMAAEAPPMASGYFWSILVMLGVPATLVAATGVGFYFAIRRHGLNAATASAQPS